MPFLERKSVAALHVATLPDFYWQLPSSLCLGLCRVCSAAETNVLVQHLALLRERGSQQHLGLGCVLAALREKHCGFSIAFQEAKLSEYQLRLSYGCVTSAVLPGWKASHQSPVEPATLQGWQGADHPPGTPFLLQGAICKGEGGCLCWWRQQSVRRCGAFMESTQGWR